MDKDEKCEWELGTVEPNTIYYTMYTYSYVIISKVLTFYEILKGW